jgi:hypothetical protein
MRGVVFLVATVAMTASSTVFGQECLRPKWTECVAFPNGGSHTGMSIQKEKIQADIPAGSKICVVNEEEIGGYTFARLTRNGQPWPNADWAANVDDFCLFKK